jgi:N-acetylglutamate synthase-like GNAT family acetyltransferase
MLNVELIHPGPEDVPELARICFEAFKRIHERHAFPLDIPNLELAKVVIGMLIARNDFYAVAARVDGKLAGSNFMSLTDEVGGVGPITVDPAFDGHGIGRTLMRAVLDHAENSGLKQVRLLQDSFNTKSLSLYASLGFDARAPIGLMNAKPAAAPDPTVRRATTADVPALDRLCRRVFKISRRGEIEAAFKFDFPVLLRENGSRVTAYAIPGFFGHGAGEAAADALAVIGETARQLPPEEALFFCPLTSGDFYRAALQAGHRLRKIMTYMTWGPFVQPEEIWMPSIAY